MAAPNSGTLRPPAAPLVTPDGYVTVVWLEYLQALAERQAALEARIVALETP
jgi:hypothetical protein